MIRYFKEQIENSSPLDETKIKSLIEGRISAGIECDTEYLQSKIGTHMLFYMIRYMSDENNFRTDIRKVFSDELDGILNESTVKYERFDYNIPIFIKL